jgi:hypothetical protein
MLAAALAVMAAVFNGRSIGDGVIFSIAAHRKRVRVWTHLDVPQVACRCA